MAVEWTYKPLEQFLTRERLSPLSAKATRGFLSRTARANLNSRKGSLKPSKHISKAHRAMVRLRVSMAAGGRPTPRQSALLFKRVEQSLSGSRWLSTTVGKDSERMSRYWTARHRARVGGPACRI